LLKQDRFDLVILDNRFGLYHAGVPSVYITHQLLNKKQEQLTEKNSSKDPLLCLLKKYDFCWGTGF